MWLSRIVGDWTWYSALAFLYKDNESFENKFSENEAHP